MKQIEVGDQVSWSHTSSRGRTITMKLREGVVESIDNKVAIVKKKRGQEKVAVRRLRAKGQRSQITEFVEAIVENNKRGEVT